MKRLKMLIGIVVLAYLGIFMYANKHGTQVFYWPSKDAVIPVFGYTTSPHADENWVEAAEDERHGVAEDGRSSATSGPEADGTDSTTKEIPRRIPLFVLIMAAFGVGFAVSWAAGTGVLAKEKLEKRQLRKKVSQLQEQVEGMQNIPPPEDTELLNPAKEEQDGSK